MQYRLGWIIALLLIVLLNHQVTAAEAELQPMLEGNQAFAWDLYGQLKYVPGNLFFSPYSISTTLAMTYAGARGETASQMANVLHCPQDPVKLHASYAAMLEEINNIRKKGKVQLSMANSLWPAKDHPLRPEFLELSQKSYGVPVTPLDYQAPETARQTINHWVEERTNQKIKDLIPSSVLENKTRLTLVNALYFKGDWAKPFEFGDMRREPFHLSTQQTVRVWMMSQTAEFRYAETDQLQLLQLPYVGGDLSMLILLPKKIDGLPALENSISAENLAKWRHALALNEVYVCLPRHKMSCRHDLDRVLKTLGMKDAFDETTADFSGMNDQRDLFISTVQHEAFVEINEKGTEAAAVTEFIVACSARSAPIRFWVNHSFLFLIQDHRTGNLLFLGRVSNPTPATEW